MKEKMILLAFLLLPLMVSSQDLELGVHVLPTSVLGDPAAFNITVRNKGEEPVEGVKALLTLKSGIEFTHVVPKTMDFNPETGLWNIGTLEGNQAKVMGVMVRYVAREDATLMAEIASSGSPDPDSTPGNGVDTNGNGKVVHDKGDEDDGDAAQIGPFKK